MKTVFLSGPYLGNIKKNTETAKKAARYLRNKGYNVFCPHVAIAGYCDDLDESYPENRKLILEMCYQWISICDYFAQLPGWNESDGCCKEYRMAEMCNKKIISLTYGQIYGNIART